MNIMKFCNVNSILSMIERIFVRVSVKIVHATIIDEIWLNFVDNGEEEDEELVVSDKNIGNQSHWRLNLKLINFKIFGADKNTESTKWNKNKSIKKYFMKGINYKWNWRNKLKKKKNIINR